MMSIHGPKKGDTPTLQSKQHRGKTNDVLLGRRTGTNSACQGGLGNSQTKKGASEKGESTE